jgi:ubiquinone/menaquinone biosynthesis C-methylase UbiE
MFDVAADAYDRLMGRYSVQLAPQLADYAGVRAGRRVLDVGCGPGALTAALVERLGAESVQAVDPSEPFVAAVRARHPDVAVERASAENLPYPDASFDAALANLVVHFMEDPVRGLSEMTRVTRPGGVVAASVWDSAGNRSPLTAFWQAARELDPNALSESHMAGTRAGHLAELLAQAGLRDVEDTALEAQVTFGSFDEWWEPYTLGVGPVGVFTRGLDAERQRELIERCRKILPQPPFTITAYAWAARGVV